jgi:hypothetical protein
LGICICAAARLSLNSTKSDAAAKEFALAANLDLSAAAAAELPQARSAR